jgi:hypothetical protein
MKTASSLARRCVLSLIGAVLAAVPAPAHGEESRFALVGALDPRGSPILGLGADDFVVREGGARCDILGVSPASYPVAIVVDTSSFARADFQQFRDSVHRLVHSLSDREVGLYTSGTPAARLVDFTRDLSRLERAIDSAFARPGESTRAFDAIIAAAQDLRGRGAFLTRIVVVSAGGPETSGRSPRDVWDAVRASRSLVDVIDLRPVRSSPTPNDRRVYQAGLAPPGSLKDEEILHTLAERTHGRYTRIFAGTGLVPALEGLRNEIQSELIVEYAPASTAHDTLQVGVHVPGAVVKGIGIESALSGR